MDWNEWANRAHRYGQSGRRGMSDRERFSRYLAGESVGSGRNHTMRDLTLDVVWFSDDIQRYMTAKSAKALGDAGALIMTIARRSTRKHRKKWIGEMTPYEKDYFAPGWSVLSSRVHRQLRKNAEEWPNKPGDPGSPANYTPSSATSLDFRNTILFGYDANTQSLVVGRVKLASRRAQSALVPQLIEHGGYAPISYGPNQGRRAYVAARPTMRLALGKALPRIERFFADSNTQAAHSTQGGLATIRITDR